MSKLLSICIPSYNMEAYLQRCVDSILAAGVNDNLEIIIVNDGSKDKTIDIAKSYKSKFPLTVVVIDKPNGHYGSCVNAALKIATGKYFRTVDADDWVDSKSLNVMINQLNKLDVDVVFTKYCLQYISLKKTVEQNTSGIVWNKILDLNRYEIPKACFSMHSITIRLEFLKSIGYVQTEGICYTDTEYVYYTLTQASLMYCIDVSLYQYFIGRDEQTMSRGSIANNYNHFYTLFQSLRTFEKGVRNFNSNFQRLHNWYFSVIFFYLFSIGFVYNKCTMERDSEIRDIYSEIVDCNKELHDILRSRKLHGMHIVRNWEQNSFLFKIEMQIVSIYRYIQKWR